MSYARTIVMSLNGESIEAVAPVRMTLVDFLRERLDFTGTHVGCEHGICGACTVLFDGASVRACLLLAVQADGHAVTTVEGLSGDGDELHPAQRAFSEEHGLQCGFCTPGFLMTTAELLDENVILERAEIRERIAGNLCRCTGYQNIVTAVQAAIAYRQQDDGRA